MACLEVSNMRALSLYPSLSLPFLSQLSLPLHCLVECCECIVLDMPRMAHRGGPGCSFRLIMRRYPLKLCLSASPARVCPPAGSFITQSIYILLSGSHALTGPGRDSIIIHISNTQPGGDGEGLDRSSDSSTITWIYHNVFLVSTKTYNKLPQVYPSSQRSVI